MIYLINYSNRDNNFSIVVLQNFKDIIGIWYVLFALQEKLLHNDFLN